MIVFRYRLYARAARGKARDKHNGFAMGYTVADAFKTIVGQHAESLAHHAMNLEIHVPASIDRDAHIVTWRTDHHEK